MPSTIFGLLACWNGHFKKNESAENLKSNLLCLMWTIRRERNARVFEDNVDYHLFLEASH